MPPPPKEKINQRKVPKEFVLTVLKDGQYQPLTQEEFNKFLQDNQDIAKYFTDESQVENMPVPDVPEQAPIYESWDKAAKRMMNTLSKNNSAVIFLEPVDP